MIILLAIVFLGSLALVAWVTNPVGKGPRKLS